MIKYITYKGEKYPIRISHSALKHFELETGKSINCLGESMEYLEILLWYALLAGHKAENKVLHLVREDCEWVLDESLAEFSNMMMNAEGSTDTSEVKKN